MKTVATPPELDAENLSTKKAMPVSSHYVDNKKFTRMILRRKGLQFLRQQ
jgi:hypothetical protein